MRARLVALQVVVFGGLLLLASPVTYMQISGGLHRDRDRYLALMARNLAAEFAASEEVAACNPALPSRCLPSPVPKESIAAGATHRPRHLLVWDGSEHVLCSDGEAAPLVPESCRQAMATMKPTYADVRWTAEVLRIIAWPFQDRSGRVLVMEVGTSFLVIEGVLSKGLAFLAMLEVAALLLLIAGSWALTSRAFAPIDQVIRRVEQIDEANLAERLPAGHRNDEVGRLVTVINHMLERLERAFEAQSRFSSDVAHEIRSPLTALRGQIEVALRRKRTAEGYREVLEESLDEVLRLARLAEDLMSLARADAGVMQIRWSEVELRELLASVLARFRPRAEEKNVSLRLHAPEAVSVLGDPGLLGRLVENLVDNALIHSPRMEEVDVRLTRGKGLVTISVEDSGSGIPAEHLPSIFDRFYRVDPARSRDMGGAGLGLAIARHIALLHGGSVEAHSTLGSGSEFRITLPCLSSETHSGS